MNSNPVWYTFTIEKELPALRAALAKSRQVILSAPPGAGKSVRVPLALDVQRHLRDELRLLLMSSTLDGVALAGRSPRRRAHLQDPAQPALTPSRAASCPRL